MTGDGLHLMIDGLVFRKPNEDQVRDFLTVMPTREYLDMTLVLGPAVYQTQEGWAGACVIAESHISIHCVGREVHADIFSCKPFDTSAAIDLTVKVLGLDKIRTQKLHRGWVEEAVGA